MTELDPHQQIENMLADLNSSLSSDLKQLNEKYNPHPLRVLAEERLAEIQRQIDEVDRKRKRFNEIWGDK